MGNEDRDMRRLLLLVFLGVELIVQVVAFFHSFLSIFFDRLQNAAVIVFRVSTYSALGRATTAPATMLLLLLLLGVGRVGGLLRPLQRQTPAAPIQNQYNISSACSGAKIGHLNNPFLNTAVNRTNLKIDILCSWQPLIFRKGSRSPQLSGLNLPPPLSRFRSIYIIYKRHCTHRLDSCNAKRNDDKRQSTTASSSHESFPRSSGFAVGRLLLLAPIS